MIEANEITLRIDKAKRGSIDNRLKFVSSCPTYQKCMEGLGESIRDHARKYPNSDEFINDAIRLITDSFNLPGRPSTVPKFENPELDS